MRYFDKQMFLIKKWAETIVAKLKMPSVVVQGEPLCGTAVFNSSHNSREELLHGFIYKQWEK